MYNLSVMSCTFLTHVANNLYSIESIEMTGNSDLVNKHLYKLTHTVTVTNATNHIGRESVYSYLQGPGPQ